MLNRYYEAARRHFRPFGYISVIFALQQSPSFESFSMGNALRKLDKTLVLVGLMGCGKSSVGRRLAARLGVGFVDSDDEIAAAAGMSIPEVFERFGEPGFRDGEAKVISRLLRGPPRVLATGGGAFISPLVRAEVERVAISVWLRADLDTLWSRVAGKPGRPLLEAQNPRAVLKELMDARYPIYATADFVVDSHAENSHEVVVDGILKGLAALAGQKGKDKGAEA